MRDVKKKIKWVRDPVSHDYMVKEGLFEKMTSDLRLEKSQNWSSEDLGTEQSTKREQKVQNPTDRT